MVFDVKPRGAGSAGAILSDPTVARVYGEFGDGCLRCYHMDIREKRTFMSAQTLRTVQAFVNAYGEEDALKIVRIMFDPLHDGNYKGQVIGKSIFNSKMRWMADQLLTESEQTYGTSAGIPNSEPDFDRLAAPDIFAAP